jgi:two-component system, chemotaxis family, sensor kinase CheA
MPGDYMSDFDNEMDEILQSFIIESNELIEKLGQDLLELEKAPTNSELQNTIFRAVHTIKGTSSFLGFDQITDLTHNYEDILNKIRRNDLSVTAEIMDVMFEAYDFMKILLERVEQKDSSPIDLSEINAKLVALGDAPGGHAEPDTTAASDAEEREPDQLIEKESGPDNPTARTPGSRTADNTLRVDVARLDSIMNLVGELVLGRNRLSQITETLTQEYEGVSIEKDLNETYSQIDFLTTELQMAVMKARMVPMAKVFNKLPRLIRDLSRETGKSIDLQVIGSENELDKSIVEELNDPLVHILRNAADHGIESPEERATAGKPETGTVVVRSRQEGNHMVISVSDDGKGLDSEKLKRKAVEKQLITEEHAREMTEQDAYNLIFTPGFSTAKVVTSVSGRGVGMDVVRTNILKLKGLIEIESALGKGTTLIIKLPLTLAIIQGLLTQVSNEIFSVPLNSVIEVVRIRKDDIDTIRNREVIRLRDSVLSLVRLSEIFSIKANGVHKEWLYVVVVGLAEQRLGIVVDSLLGQKEVVIKSLGSYLGNVKGIAGSTILGDGRVIVIIDVAQLMKMCIQINGIQ